MRRRRHTVPMGADEDDHPLEQPDGGPGPETQVLSGLMDERIGRALLRLKPNHRQCLILSDVEDMSSVQIGEVMGMSQGAVRVLLCRARGEMRRLLAAEGLVR
jgi:RNA polymerase sigma-70 factor (ECF subfamily)